ncbi:type II secretion system minor pseudopilin GspK [Thalassolituus sp. LLYu03]|uniref:type II secretion system minor pseudopilin GspK n=1 Tax=Thalassolituus sp. LLYu03 TaxID=3421656 RepID=UPI003D26CED1
MKQQKGLALLMVLLIFAIISVLAVAMIDRQSSDIQRSATMLALQQARSYVIGAESAVRTGLYLDWDNNKDVDHDKEEWNQERTFPLSPGTARIRIQDAQGRFNLNSLSKGASNRAVQKERFTNLLNELGLDVAFADELYRWMDESSQEDDRYQAMEPPYRAAYQGCSHTSELMLLDGLDETAYKRLEAYVACLPITTQLNINTATAPVLSALDSKLSLSDAEAIISARGDKGFASVDDFWALSQVEPFTKETSSGSSSSSDSSSDSSDSTSGSGTSNASTRWDKADFSVKSEYFETFIRIELGDRIATGEILIHRDNATGTMNTLYRDYSRREGRRPADISSTTTTQ